MTRTFVLETGQAAGERLDKFVAGRCPQLSRSRLQQLIADGCVTLDGAPTKAASRLKPGQTVVVEVPPPAPSHLPAQEVPFGVVWEDSDVMIVDKPAGLTVHPAPGHRDRTLVNGILARTPELLDDADFASNALRVRNRDRLIPQIESVTRTRGTAAWMEALEAAGVPCAPVNTIDQVFADPQVEARGMQIRMPHPLAGEDIRLVGSPIELSRTPVSYRLAPPTLGQHTDEVLAEVLALSESERAALRDQGVI